MENLPFYIEAGFIATALLTALLFIKAAGYSPRVAFIIGAWLIIQGFISNTGLYTKTGVMPPPFLLTIVPALLLILSLFISKQGRGFIDSLNIKTLTWLHVIRIPVEFTLLGLSIHKAIPGIMTFEGQNFDIVSGITAPVIYYFVFIKRMNDRLLLVWNFICLGLLLNIVIMAVLSAPFPFQRLAFDQPNIAILYFPFSWLPACVVPLVLLSHLAAIRQIIIRNKRKHSTSGQSNLLVKIS